MTSATVSKVGVFIGQGLGAGAGIWKVVTQNIRLIRVRELCAKSVLGCLLAIRWAFQAVRPGKLQAMHQSALESLGPCGSRLVFVMAVSGSFDYLHAMRGGSER